MSKSVTRWYGGKDAVLDEITTVTLDGREVTVRIGDSIEGTAEDAERWDMQPHWLKSRPAKSVASKESEG